MGDANANVGICEPGQYAIPCWVPWLCRREELQCVHIHTVNMPCAYGLCLVQCALCAVATLLARS